MPMEVEVTKVVVEASLSRGNAIGTAGMIDDSLVSFDLITVKHRKVSLLQNS